MNVRGKSRISGIEPLQAEFAFALTMVVVAFAGVSAAPCANSFDGSWNVVLITQSGGCERSGQVAGQIVNGALVYSAGGVSVSGRVNSEGKLNGKATMGPYYLIGSGRLVSNSGSGTWQAVSSCWTLLGYLEREAPVKPLLALAPAAPKDQAGCKGRKLCWGAPLGPDRSRLVI